MNALKITGAILVLAVCIGSAAAQIPDCAPQYTGGVDFYGNDIISKGSKKFDTPELCVAACVADPACFAIVQKDTGLCFLKTVDFGKDVRIIANTVLAVDLSCAKGSPPVILPPATPAPIGGDTTPPDAAGGDTTPPPAMAGVPPGMTPGTYVDNGDGTWTTTSTVPVGDGTKFVTTKITYVAANYDTDTTNDVLPDAPTVMSYYSDAAGVAIEGADPIADPTLTATPPTMISASTVVPDQADPVITTFMPNADGSPAAVYSSGGVIVGTGTPPPADGTAAPPTVPPGTRGTTVVDDKNGTTTLTNTITVPNTSGSLVSYVTIETVVSTADPSQVVSTRAYYSDAAGVPVEGVADLPASSVSNPAAVYPEPLFVSTAVLPDGAGSLTSSGVMDPVVGLTSYGFDGVIMMPPPLSAMMPPPASTIKAPPPSGTTVPITAPRSSSAQSLQMVGAFVAVTLFSALML